MISLASAWNADLQQLFPVFTAPTTQIFFRLATGWVLCTARRTITGIIPFADPDGIRSHDIYHRFFSGASWSPPQMWELLARMLVRIFYATGIIPLDLDDTVFHHVGRKVDGAAFWRDAVRSTATKVVHCWGLNLVVLTLRVIPPWGGEPLGLPINLRLHRKNGPTLIDLAEAMLRQLTAWFPERSFRACMDGFYATMAGRDLPQISLVSRIRCDAAIYELPPQRRRKQRGRKRRKGVRLPTPTVMARHIRSWQAVSTNERGRKRKRLIYARQIIWYKVSAKPVLLVISRDPTGKEKDDFFFTTDPTLRPAQVIEIFAGRWSIEDTFKNAKQLLCVEQPQTWRGPGPERVAVMGLVLYSLVWTWYLQRGYRPKSLFRPSWYIIKTHPSFTDALAMLRRVLWQERIISRFGKGSVHYKISEFLLPALERAA
jgi:hypothetical protein